MMVIDPAAIARIARIALTVLLALLFLTTGSSKIFGISASQAMRQTLHIELPQWRTIGALEYLGVLGLIVGFWLPLAGLAASIGLALLMVGAVAARVRAGGKQGVTIAFDIVVFLLAIALAILQVRAI